MGKKEPLEPSVPSKAYLVSFGDTMTALLAFFIVLNSLAKEQTGANMYSGTGSFVNAFSKSGMPGGLPENRSSDMIQQESQQPIYALADNKKKNEGNVGPDDVNKKDQIKDRDNESFQKFLSKVEKKFGLENNASLMNQTAFDSFEKPKSEDDGISRHAIELLTNAIAQLRDPNVSVEVIVWATMPSKTNLEKHLKTTVSMRSKIESMFWLQPEQKKRVRYRAKPWLFADARRPVMSVVISQFENANDSE